MNNQSKELAELFLAGNEKQALYTVQAYLQNHTKNELYSYLRLCSVSDRNA